MRQPRPGDIIRERYVLRLVEDLQAGPNQTFSTREEAERGIRDERGFKFARDYLVVRIREEIV